jgi:hypothetical protein
MLLVCGSSRGSSAARRLGCVAATADGWLVEVSAASSNGQSRIGTTLWLTPEVISPAPDT